MRGRKSRQSRSPQPRRAQVLRVRVPKSEFRWGDCTEPSNVSCANQTVIEDKVVEVEVKDPREPGELAILDRVPYSLMGYAEAVVMAVLEAQEPRDPTEDKAPQPKLLKEMAENPSRSLEGWLRRLCQRCGGVYGTSMDSHVFVHHRLRHESRHLRGDRGI